MTRLYESGAYWDLNPSFHEEDSQFKVEKATELIESCRPRPSSILDFGCGAGLTTLLLARHFRVPVTGVDISPDAIARAQERFQDDLVSYRATPLEELGERFDLGVMLDVIEHVPDYFGLLREARDKATHWLFNIPLDMSVLAVLTGSFMTLRESVGHLHYFSRESALATLEECGFTLVDHRLVGYVVHNLRHRPGWRNVLAAVPRLLLFRLSPAVAVRLVGGASLMVLCRSADR